MCNKHDGAVHGIGVRHAAAEDDVEAVEGVAAVVGIECEIGTGDTKGTVTEVEGDEREVRLANYAKASANPLHSLILAEYRAEPTIPKNEVTS